MRTSDPRLRVADRVLDQSVERPVEISARAPAAPRLADALAGELDCSLVGGLLPPLQRAIGRRRDVELLAWRLALASAAEDEQLVDDLRETIHLPDPGIDLIPPLTLGGVLAKLLELQANPRQGRAELVGSVRDELLLPAQEFAEASGHPVERTSQRALLAASLDRSGRGQITLLDPASRLLQPPDRARRLPGDQRTGDRSEKQDHASKEHEAEDRPTGRPVDGGGALGDADGADRPARSEYRHGCREDLGPEGLAGATPLEGLPAQGRGDLGPGRVACSDLGGAGAVRDHPVPCGSRRSPCRAGSAPRWRPGAAASPFESAPEVRARWRRPGRPGRAPGP